MKKSKRQIFWEKRVSAWFNKIYSDYKKCNVLPKRDKVVGTRGSGKTTINGLVSLTQNKRRKKS